MSSIQKWSPAINDPVISCIINFTSVEHFYPTVETFNIWRANNEKFEGVYIKFEGSHNIIYVCPAMNNRIVGVWDIDANLGYCCQGLHLIDFNKITLTYSVYHKSKVTKSNKELFSINTSKTIQEIHELSKSLLEKMLLSPDFKNRDPNEVAIRAIKSASAYYQQFESFSNLYFQSQG